MSKLLSFLTICILICFAQSTLRSSKFAQISLKTNFQVALDLGVASGFAILSQSGVTDVPTSSIVGNVGSYPITGAAILLTCPEVSGTIFQVDAAGPTCFTTSAPFLLTAVSDMATAFTAANSLVNPNFTELYAGDISGKTMTPGLYKWSSSVVINSDVYLSGNCTDVWIFIIAGTLSQASATKVTLLGSAKASNVFWVVAGAYVNIGAGALMQGTILAKAAINLTAGASVKGRLLAQTAVTLQSNSVVIPKL